MKHSWINNWTPIQRIFIGFLFFGVLISSGFLLTRLWHLEPSKSSLLVQQSPLEFEISQLKQKIQKDKNPARKYLALAKKYIKLADQKNELGWYHFAAEATETSLLKEPNLFEAYVVLARIDLASHQFEPALKKLSKARKDLLIMRDILLLETDIFLAQGKYRKAKTQVENTRTILSFPQYIQRQGRVRKLSEKALQDYITLTNARAVYLSFLTGDKEGQSLLPQTLKEMALASPTLQSWFYQVLTHEYLMHGDYPNAWQFLSKARNLAPLSYKGQLLLLKYYIHTQAYLKAQKQLEQMPENEPLVNLYKAHVARLLKESHASFIEKAKKGFEKEQSQSTNFGHRRDYVNLLLASGTPSDLQEAQRLIRVELNLRKDRDTLLVAMDVALASQEPLWAKTLFKQLESSCDPLQPAIIYQKERLENQLPLTESPQRKAPQYEYIQFFNAL